MAHSQAISPDQAVPPEQATPSEKAAAREEAIKEVMDEVVEAKSKDPESAVSEYKRAYHITIGVLVGLAVVGGLLFIAITQP